MNPDLTVALATHAALRDTVSGFYVDVLCGGHNFPLESVVLAWCGQTGSCDDACEEREDLDALCDCDDLNAVEGAHGILARHRPKEDQHLVVCSGCAGSSTWPCGEIKSVADVLAADGRWPVCTLCHRRPHEEGCVTGRGGGPTHAFAAPSL